MSVGGGKRVKVSVGEKRERTLSISMGKDRQAHKKAEHRSGVAAGTLRRGQEIKLP